MSTMRKLKLSIVTCAITCAACVVLPNGAAHNWRSSSWLEVVAAFLSIISFAILITATHAAVALARLDAAPLRPDYSRIAAMEKEIYGEVFTHDGAPAPAAARSWAGVRFSPGVPFRVCPAGHPFTGSDPAWCAACNAARAQGKIDAHNQAASEWPAYGAVSVAPDGTVRPYLYDAQKPAARCCAGCGELLPAGATCAHCTPER